MYTVWQILSGEIWNGQTSAKDFKEIRWVTFAESKEELDEIMEGHEDYFYEKNF